MNESPQETARRIVLNTWVRAKGVTAKSQFIVQQKLKEREIDERKRIFGVDYMNLIMQPNSAGSDQLEECLSSAKADLEQLTAGLLEITSTIKALDEDTEAKLIVEPNAYSEQ